MKIDKIYIVFMLLLFLLFIGNVTANEQIDADSLSADDNSSIELVSNQIDESSTSLSEGDNSSVLEDSGEIEVNDWDDLKYYCSLSDKNYNLKLKENTNYYPSDPTSDDYQIVIKNNVTITGSSGAYIGDASPNARVIKYMPIKVEDKSKIGITLQGITFKWIETNYQTDGVFLTMGGNVNNTVKDCNFYNITTNNGHSSILHIKYGDLDVINCTFVNCTTDFGCISVYCPEDIPTTVCTSARMVVRDSYFESNYAKTEPGCINNCGLLSVYNTTFYRNSAFWWAGAIHTHGGGNTSIYDSNFTDNLAGWNGGALYTYSYLQIYNTTFRGNNCTTNNGGGAIGACNYLHNPYIYIVDCLFEDNNNNCWGLSNLSTEGTGRGGAISFMDQGAIAVHNSTFIHNSASMGSAIAIIARGSYGSPDVELVGNKFINNTKIGDVLYIYLSSTSNAEIRNNTFENSTIELSKLRIVADDPVGDDITVNIDASLVNPSAYDEDVLDKVKFHVYVDGVFYRTIIGKKFVYNFEDDEKHDIYIRSSISSDVSNTISVSNKKEYIFVSKSSGNDNNDGKSRTSPVATLSKAISLASATGNIYILDGTFSESNLKINYDLVITGENNVVISGTNGNLFNANSSSLTIKNIQFSNLKQTGTTTRIISASDLLILENCRFIGGTYWQAIETRELRVYDSIFDGINVNHNIIYADILEADNITVSNNKFVGYSVDCALLYGESISDWKILNSNFKYNTDLKAGCIYLQGSSTSEVKIYNVTFDSNRMYDGESTAYTAGIYFASAMNVNIDYSLFINNDNSYNIKGAIIYCGSSDGTKVSISNSVFLNNTHGSSSTIFYASGSNLGKITANYNWFGNSGNTTPDLNNKINYNFWYTINASASLDKLGPGEKAIITFDLNYVISKAGEIIYSKFKYPYSAKLTLSATKGALNTTEITLKDGVASVEFTKSGFEDSIINFNYVGGNSNLKIYGSKNTPVLSVETSNITAGDDLVITVYLSNDATGETILNFAGVNHTLSFNNGIATKTFSSLQEGNYPITVIFKGDSKYLAKTVTDYVTSTKLDSFINVEVSDIYVGDDLSVSVTVPSNATGNVTVNIGDKTLTKEVNNGHVSFSISGLAANNYTLIANYSGSIRYSGSEDTKSVVVSKYESITQISADLTDLQLGQQVIITVDVLPDATGNVSFNHNGNIFNLSISNGQVIYTIDSITKGDHVIEATYCGDSKYLSSQDSVRFSVAKLNSTVSVSVGDIVYGQNAAVIVTPISGATGNVTVTISNKSYTGFIVGGKAILNISGISAGEKAVDVVYNGDDDYLPSSGSTTFNVGKANPSFTVGVNSIMVGNEVIVKISVVNDMTGNFTLTAANQTANRKIQRGAVSDWRIPNLKPDNYTLSIVYNGDNNYYVGKYTASFSVSDYPIPQVSNEGIDKNNDKSPFEGLVNGKVLFEINLENNINGSIVIDAEGNIYFASKTNLFGYDKNGQLLWNYSAYAVGKDTLSGVTIGRNVLISPMQGNTLYFVNITSGEKYGSSNIYQGSSVFSPIIDENYNIYITSEFQMAEGAYELVIIPYNIWKEGGKPLMIEIGAEKPLSTPVIIDNNNVAIATVGGIKIIDIEARAIVNTFKEAFTPVAGQAGAVYALSSDSVVAFIGGIQQWKTKVTGGVGNYLALDSDLGYLYSVNGNGVLYKYDIGNGEESFVYDFKENVTSNVLIDNEGVIYLGTESGMFYSLDGEGNIFWRVNLNDKITGNPVMDEDGLIYVIVNNSKIVKLGSDQLKDSNINVNVADITYGDNLTVEITFDNEITGTISVSLDGNIVNSTSVNDKTTLVLSVPNIDAGGHVLSVVYSGDKRFKQYNSNTSFSVSKQDINVVVISCGDISVGDNAFIEITLPQGATGNATMTMGNDTRTIIIDNQTIRIDLGNNLKADNYTVYIKYNGNNNFNVCENSTKFTVSKIKVSDSCLTITNSKCSIDLANDAGGSLKVSVDNKVYKTVNVVNGAATVSLSGLSSGDHKIILAYSGDDKYESVTKETTIHIPVLKLAGSDVTMLYTSGAKYKVRLTSDGAGLSGKSVTFVVNGKKSSAKTDSKGYASVSLNLPPKSTKYTVSATYGNLKVTNKVKVNSIMSAKNMNVKKSAKSFNIKVTLKKVNGKYLKSKKITLKFNGKKYTAKTNAKGVATFKMTKKIINKLKAGKKYTYQATYLKDSVKKTVKVKK